MIKYGYLYWRDRINSPSTCIFLLDYEKNTCTRIGSNNPKYSDPSVISLDSSIFKMESPQNIDYQWKIFNTYEEIMYELF